MKNIDWKAKLTSRKFWVAIASFVTMIATALGASEDSTTQIAALIMAGASAIAYVLGEGLVDAKGSDKEIELIMGEEVKEDEVE